MMFVTKRKYEALLQEIASMERRLTKLERPRTVTLPVPKEAQSTCLQNGQFYTRYWEAVPVDTVINALVKATGLCAYPEKSLTVPLNVCVPQPAPVATPKKKARE